MAPTLATTPAQVPWALLSLLLWKAVSQWELLKFGLSSTAQSYPAVE